MIGVHDPEQTESENTTIGGDCHDLEPVFSFHGRMTIDSGQCVVTVEYLLQDRPHFRVFKQHNKVTSGVKDWVKQA